MAVTYKCNSRCLTCNTWKVYLERPIDAEKELSKEELERFFERYNRFFWLSITGGEPFLRKDLSDIVRYAFESSPTMKILNIPTNGMHPNLVKNSVERILNDTEIPYFMVSVSLDGPRDIHERVRRVNGSWKKAIETIKALERLRAENPNLIVTFEHTISQFNVGAYHDLLAALKEEGLTEVLKNHTVTFMHHGQLYHNSISEVKSKEDIRILYDTIRKRESRFSYLGFIREIYLTLFEDYINQPNRQVLTCTAASRSCFIDPYGDVYPCVIWNEKIGNLREVDYDLYAVMESEKAERIRMHVREGICPVCWTPCEAYPAMITNPLKALLKSAFLKTRNLIR